VTVVAWPSPWVFKVLGRPAAHVGGWRPDWLPRPRPWGMDAVGKVAWHTDGAFVLYSYWTCIPGSALSSEAIDINRGQLVQVGIHRDRLNIGERRHTDDLPLPCDCTHVQFVWEELRRCWWGDGLRVKVSIWKYSSGPSRFWSVQSVQDGALSFLHCF
jgi:hypothetical protein